MIHDCLSHFPRGAATLSATGLIVLNNIQTIIECCEEAKMLLLVLFLVPACEVDVSN